jgi:hypothetical protein
MKRLIFLFFFTIPLIAQLQMKRVVYINSGLHSTIDGEVVCADCNRNNKNELIFRTLLTGYPYYWGWQIWEYQPINHYEVVYVDTGWPAYGQWPLGIDSGNIRPFEAENMDTDNIVDLIGPMQENFHPDTTPRPLTTVMEGPDSSSYPVTLIWFDRLWGPFNVTAHYITDLDADGVKEIFLGWSGPRIYENTGNNQYTLVFNSPPGTPGSWGGYAFGDFDRDGRMEIAYPGGGPYFVYIRECVGNNQYPVVCSLPFPQGLTNPIDCWEGNDVDQDSKPEFFIAFDVEPTFYLYMWEATGNNTYERTFIDQKTIYGISGRGRRRSKCGDIDGDGVEELVWATHTKLFVYKATGNNQFQQVWQWNQDHGEPGVIVNIYDMNKNGYNEIVVGGGGKTSIFEVEAVQLLRPNGGEIFHADSCETIQWQKFYPPRCDSLSLFYSIDNGINYTMITHGISGNDTSYLWTVPNVNSDSCKIKIIAYGPGWQYDESDGVFRITNTGIEEQQTLEIKQLSLKISPNLFKSQSSITLSLPEQQKVSLKLYNITGKLIKVLCDGKKEQGIYKISLNSKDLSSGVYFLTLQTSSKKLIERFVIVK